MASAAGRRARHPHPSQAVDIGLLATLNSCLVNLPATLVSLLANQNTLAQDVVVELQYRPAAAAGADARARAPAARSVFVGWTGMPSRPRPAPAVGGDGAGSGRHEKEAATVEVDAAFARRVGMGEGTKARVRLHVDPPHAHTVTIEPLTAADWELIELHAAFLELNLLAQVRALPNPAAGPAHPLTLHLTPLSTAAVVVTSLAPAPAATQPFAKIAADAEVIVAPKTRPGSARDNRSTASAGRRSAGARSAASQPRHRSARESETAPPPLFLRPVTRALPHQWFGPGGDDGQDDGEDDGRDAGLRVWLDREHLRSGTLQGVAWVAVTLVTPTGLQEAAAPPAPPSPDPRPARRVVAQAVAWDDAPDSRHVALSSLLCSVLACEGIVGGIVRIDPAPPALPRTASALKDASPPASRGHIVTRLRITPFAPTPAEAKAGGVTFGGESTADRDEAAQRLLSLLGPAVLEGPITDGMLLPPREGWPGGILDFDPAPPGDPSTTRTHWLVGGERKLDIAVQAETARPKASPSPLGAALPEAAPTMVGIDATIEQTRKSLLHTSSVLLTGALGAGKTSLAHLLAHQLRNEFLFHVVYLPCRTLAADDTRVKTVKDTLHRVFASAAWSARLGGRSLVILDDLDTLCPVETELQVDANGRSRQVSELLCSTVRQWCRRDTGVVMLATAPAKEAVHNIVVVGHVVRDIIALKAPSKDGRRAVLELLVQQATHAHRRDEAVAAPRESGAAREWMEGSDGEPSRPPSAHAPDGGEADLDPDLDLLDIAGRTDGYMPGDLALLVSRARREALIRAASDPSRSDHVGLTGLDFTAALHGFTPASLRGVTLHSSTTTFASIGGLGETRQTLLETLQYPTTYAPLFATCPLRLRSGLLLYGYPGCGKTLLASAVAGECGLNFISVKGPEILNKYIGASEKSVRDLFERAEAAKPCVLFFDEFDAIAPKRGHDSTGVTDRVVNMLLTMMDGAEGLSGVYVLAATSRPDLIDPALLRPGRLDKSLLCDMPREADRLDILRATSRRLHLAPDLLPPDRAAPHTLHEVARRTDGYSGADLQAVLYNAHLDAIHDLLGGASAPDLGGGHPNHAARRPSPPSSSSSSPPHHDFTWFPMGHPDGPAEATPAQRAASRAHIAAQLRALDLARRRPRPSPPAAHPAPAPVVVQWHHLDRSLRHTRASLPPHERARLARIYHEFVVGRRPADLADGQAGTDIGARASLM